MLNLISILIMSLGISSAQANAATKIVLIDEENKINQPSIVIKGSDLTPDCNYPWSVRKYKNSGGQQVIDVNNGKLSFQVIPSRGMAIQKAMYQSSTGQVTMGGPGFKFNGGDSPVIGSVGASFVEAVIDRTPPYKITIRGKINESLPNDSKLQTITEISTIPGASTFQFSNTIDFAAINAKTAVSGKPTITIADLSKPAPDKTWEPSFKDWYGKPAPDFTITDLTGNKQKVSDYKGKNLILNFWATWCPPCRAEIPDFIELRKTMSEKDLAILGISIEDGQTDTVKRFVADKKMNYTTMITDFKALSAPFNKIEVIPTTFFIDPKGNFKFASLGALTLEDMKNILQAQ